MKSNEEWSSQLLTQFMQLHKKPEKNSGLFQACINCIHSCEHHSSFDFISAFIIWLFHIYHSHNNEGSLIHRGDANFLHTMLWKMQWYTFTPDALSILFPGLIDLFCIPTCRVVIKSREPGIFPGYFYWKIEEKEKEKKSLGVWFPAYLLYLPGNLKS